MALALLQLSLVHSLVADRGFVWAGAHTPYGLMVVLSLTGLLVSAIANILWPQQKPPI